MPVREHDRSETEEEIDRLRDTLDSMRYKFNTAKEDARAWEHEADAAKTRLVVSERERERAFRERNRSDRRLERWKRKAAELEEALISAREGESGANHVIDCIDMEIGRALEEIDRYPPKPAEFSDRVSILCRAAQEVHRENKALKKDLRRTRWVNRMILANATHALERLEPEADNSENVAHGLGPLHYITDRIKENDPAVIDSDEPIPTEVDAFFDDVKKELEVARAKYPGRKIRGLALAAEFGEVMQALLKESNTNLRKEAIQTIVTACRLALEGDSSVDEWRESRGLDPVPGTSEKG